MRVIELAQELSVDAEALVSLLRQMGIPVAGKDATITDGQHDKVLAKVERERRAGSTDPAAAIQAALEEAAPAPKKRRRRRRKEDVVEAEPVAEEVEDSVEGTEAELTGATRRTTRVRSSERSGSRTAKTPRRATTMPRWPVTERQWRAMTPQPTRMILRPVVTML